MSFAGQEIRVERLTKEWGSTRAVDEISFVAAPGSFTVLLGPSGCGKSTTLRLVAGIESATSGRIAIGGRDVTALPPGGRGLAMVFQSYALFPHLSVRENIVFGLKVRKLPKAEREARLQRAASLLGIAHLLARRPSQISGGQQQRVALGRAIVAEAPVCLMDEPLSNLDAKLRHEMRQEIRALQRRLGITMLYVTHDQAEAMSMADRVILMRDGRIEQDAPPDELYDKPATAFAARFIGTPPMNLLALADAPSGAAVSGTDRVVRPGPGDGLLLGVRPEDLGFDDSGVPSRVRAVEYLGADSLVACSVGDQTCDVRVPGRTPLEPGADCYIRLPAQSRIHLFDAASGRRRDEPARPPASAEA